MRCPVCEMNATAHWLRGFLIGFCMALLIGFIGGQLFHGWQYDRPLKAEIGKLEDRNQELRKGFVPVQPGRSGK